MIRTYIRIKYEYSPIYDSEYYKEAARIINRCLMGKLDNLKNFHHDFLGEEIEDIFCLFNSYYKYAVSL